MSRVIYSTRALVLAARPYGEANKLFTLLTRELGTVEALATSVRLERSKLRYALTTLSLVNVSLVAAKRGWRITTAEPVTSFFFETRQTRRRALALRITTLLRRLAIGETKEPTLFDLTVESLEVLQELPDKHIKGFEIVCVIRILENLGYGIEGIGEEYYGADMRNFGLYEDAAREKARMVRSINKALEMSGL